MAIDNIDPNELSLQDAAGMQLVHVIRRIIEEINNGGDTPTPTPSEPTGIYYCTFDVTTKNEITAAIADELLPVCFHADKMHYLVAYQYGVYTFATISRDRGIISRIDCRVNGWSVQEPLEIQKLLTFDFSPTENSTNPVTSGGVYTAINNITIDPQDIADAVDDWLNEHSSSIGGLTFEAKQALMNCFAHVAWIDANGQTYYDALYNALFNTATLESIYALFIQGSAVIYDTDSLDSLRQYLVVTAYYSDETSAVVSDYTLSGTLTVGTSTITASYGGKSSTFNVTVSQRATLSSISAVFNQGSAVVYTTDTLDSLKQYLTVTANYSDSSTAIVPSADYTLSGTLTVGTSTVTVSYQGKSDTFSVVVSQPSPLPVEYQQVEYIKATGTQHIYTDVLANNGALSPGNNNINLYSADIDFQFDEWQSNYPTNIMFSCGSSGGGWIGYNNTVQNIATGTSSGQYFSGTPTLRHQYHWYWNDTTAIFEREDSASISRSNTETSTVERRFALFYAHSNATSNFHFIGKLFSCVLYKSNVKVLDLIPCYRKADSEIGLYDTVNNRFYTNNGTGTFLKGADVT